MTEEETAVRPIEEDGTTSLGLTRYIFECECGRELRADSYTECDRCGAHYVKRGRVEGMVQLVPPIEPTDGGEWS